MDDKKNHVCVYVYIHKHKCINNVWNWINKKLLGICGTVYGLLHLGPLLYFLQNYFPQMVKKKVINRMKENWLLAM